MENHTLAYVVSTIKSQLLFLDVEVESFHIFRDKQVDYQDLYNSMLKNPQLTVFPNNQANLNVPIVTTNTGPVTNIPQGIQTGLFVGREIEYLERMPTKVDMRSIRLEVIINKSYEITIDLLTSTPMIFVRFLPPYRRDRIFKEGTYNESWNESYEYDVPLTLLIKQELDNAK